MVVGAAADGNGKLLTLPGVETQSNYKQQIIQWCYDNLSPPISPLIAEPIEAPDDPQKVCYVVFVEESLETPHFINGRKGCYIRTDEFSQRFEPRLATYEEIAHLANRRSEAIERRARLFARSEQRFDAAVQLDYSKSPGVVGGIGTTLKLAIAPRFPHRPLIDQAGLDEIIATQKINRGGVSFPQKEYERVHQHESVLVPGPCRGFSMLEATTWGHVYYAVELEHVVQNEATERRVVHMAQLLGNLLVFLRHGGNCLRTLGYNGSIGISLKLERTQSRSFLRPERRDYVPDPFDTDPSPPYDDAVVGNIESTSEALLSNCDHILRELVTLVGFAINWPEVSDPATLKRAVSSAYGYNHWPAPAE